MRPMQSLPTNDVGKSRHVDWPNQLRNGHRNRGRTLPGQNPKGNALQPPRIPGKWVLLAACALISREALLAPHRLGKTRSMSAVLNYASVRITEK